MSEQVVPDNSCARAEQCLPDYWQDELGSGDRAWLDQHLQTCAECAELAAFWRELGQLPDAEPDPRERRRFDTMLAAYAATPSRLPWSRGWRRLLQPLPLGLAIVLLLAGLGSGWWLRGLGHSAKDQTSEIAALREEVHDTRQLVVLSMLQQQSANDRLAGVSYSNHVSPPDPRIMQALLHSLQYDPSPDVRLAALDALQHAGGGGEAAPAVTRGLVEAFPYQNSPLVQVALVDSLLELRPPAARALLQNVSANRSYSPEVRQRAAWGLSHWN
jgi:HEAT repeat protein